MTLKTKFLLLTCAFVLLALLISKWATVGATKVFLTEHAREMEARYGSQALTESLEGGRQALLNHLVLLHLLIAATTIALLVSVLHLTWKRLVEKRMNSVLQYMSRMERGIWEAEVPDPGGDEVGAIARAANRLGEQITTTAQQFGDASKLAALALLGQSLIRDTNQTHDQLCSTLAMLKLRKEHNEETLQPIINNLDSAIRRLQHLPQQFQREFDNQLRQHATKSSLSAQGPPDSSDRLTSRKPPPIGTPNASTSGEGTGR